MNIKQNPTKRHHYVPESYLKQFSAQPESNFFIKEGPKLCTLDIKKLLQGNHVRIGYKYPAHICYKENYYKITKELLDGDIFHLADFEELFIENKLLTRLENEYESIISDLITQRYLPMSKAIDLVDFILLLKVRNPSWFEFLIKSKDKFIDESLIGIHNDFLLRFEHQMTSNNKKMLRELISKLAKQYKSSPEFAKQMQLSGILNRGLNTRDERSLASNNVARELMLNQGWILLKCPDNGPFFVTTDNPGVSINKDDTVVSTKFMGNYHFIFPLSQTYCLSFGQFPNLADNAYSLNAKQKYVGNNCLLCDAEKVITINNKIIQIYHELLIAPEPDYLEKIRVANIPKKKQ